MVLISFVTMRWQLIAQVLDDADWASFILEVLDGSDWERLDGSFIPRNVFSSMSFVCVRSCLKRLHSDTISDMVVLDL